MSTPILNAAIADKNAAFSRLCAAQNAVARWPHGGAPLPEKLAEDARAAEVAYRAAAQRADDLLQRRRESKQQAMTP